MSSVLLRGVDTAGEIPASASRCRSARWPISAGSTPLACLNRRSLPRRARNPDRNADARNSVTPALPATIHDAADQGDQGNVRSPLAAGKQRIIWTLASLRAVSRSVTGASRGIGYFTALALAKEARM